MTWHRFWVALPFALFMFFFFNVLGYYGAGRVTKRNVTLSTIGSVIYLLLTMPP